jgi:aminoglycoside phosphotransferase (APT) family kinase protein
VNGELVVRLKKDPDVVTRAESVRREAAILELVHEVVAVPTPEVEFAFPEKGWLAYRKLPGIPLLNVPSAQRLAGSMNVAGTLGKLLRSLRDLPGTLVADIAEVDRLPLVEWRDEAETYFDTVAHHVPPVNHRPILEFFRSPPPPDGDALVFSHNDLGIEHVLVDDAATTVTGVLDWSDAALVDPAFDFGRLLRDLGPMICPPDHPARDISSSCLRRTRWSSRGLRESALPGELVQILGDLAYQLGARRPGQLAGVA